MFLEPKTIDLNGKSEVVLNPVLEANFGSLFRPARTLQLSTDKHALQTRFSEYATLSTLSWSTNHHKLFAMMGKEASWRKMLVSQPPIQRVDWWHQFESADRRTAEQFTHLPQMTGHGHELNYSSPMTLGWLYDFYESRLIRGCAMQTAFFTSGGSGLKDFGAPPDEIRWEIGRLGPGRSYSQDVPCISIRSTQTWPGAGPSKWQRFDIPYREWEVRDELPFACVDEFEERKWSDWIFNGTHWLAFDCERDGDEARSGRWSRSEGWRGAGMKAQSSGFSRAELPA